LCHLQASAYPTALLDRLRYVAGIAPLSHGQALTTAQPVQAASAVHSYVSLLPGQHMAHSWHTFCSNSPTKYVSFQQHSCGVCPVNHVTNQAHWTYALPPDRPNMSRHRCPNVQPAWAGACLCDRLFSNYNFEARHRSLVLRGKCSLCLVRNTVSNAEP
jgi:hypothetical protein